MIFAIISEGFENKFHEEIMFLTGIEICGRDFCYSEAIDEFCQKYKGIEYILISESFYKDNLENLKLMISKYNTKNVYVLFEKLLDKIEYIEGINYITIQEFLNDEKNKYSIELRKGENENMDLENGIELVKNGLDIANEMDLLNDQKNFLDTSIGKAVNVGLDIGIRALLPNAVEEGVIAVKDAIMENGFKEGIKQSIEDVVEITKNAGKVLTGNFENIEQVQMAVKSGGLIDMFSGALDLALKFANQMGSLDKTTYQMLKVGKNTILNTISSKIDDELTNQLKYVQKLDNYSSKWKEAYEVQDFASMEKAYNNMENYLDKTMPFERTLQEARNIENLHNLIKNNGKNFDLSENEIELAKRLSF